MSIVVQHCSQCTRPFFPTMANAQPERLCPACLGQRHPAAAGSALAPPVPVSSSPSAHDPSSRPRFAPVGVLPPDRRQLPAATPPASAGTLTPRQLIGQPSAKAHRPAAIRQLGFNCPACLVILVIRQPEEYDGRAAPCPHCGTVILPPRIAPPTPFVVLSPPGAGLGLPQPGQAAAPAAMKRTPLPPLRPVAPVQAPPHETSGVRKSLLPPARDLAKAAIY